MGGGYIVILPINPIANFQHAFPTDEEIIQIVTEKLSPLGISPDEFAATTVGSTTEDERVVQKSVYFYRQINNCPIWGEAQLVLDIDSQGQLVGLTNDHLAFAVPG